MNKTIKFGLLMMFTLLLSSFAFADLKTNNELYLSFNENDTTGTIYSNSITGVTGVVDGALDFDGTNDYLRTTDFDRNQDWSISMWINPDTINNNEFLVSCGDGLDFHIDGTGAGGTGYRVYTGSAWVFTGASGDFTANTWGMLTLTYDTDTDTLKMYAGSTEEESVSSTTFTTGTSQCTIGHRNDLDSSRNYDGSIDEYKLWSKTLTSTEVTNLYNAGTPIINSVGSANLVKYLPMDSLYDWSSNDRHAQQISTMTGVSGLLDTAFDFDGANDYLNLGNLDSVLTESSDWSINGYFKTSASGIYNQLWGWRKSTSPNTQIGLLLLNSNTLYFSTSGETGDSFTIQSASTYNDGIWHQYTVTFDENGAWDNVSLYIDGVFEGSSVGALGDITLGYDFPIGYRGETGGQYFNGVQDDFSTWSKVLTSDEITELYNSGNGFNPYSDVPPTPAPPTVLELTESTALVRQTVPVEVNTPSLTTVFASTYSIDVNTTDLYGEYNFNVESNLNNEIYCEIQINGVAGANVTRSNIANQLGSISLMTPIFTQENGTYTQELACSKIGAGKVTVTNAVGIGHLLVSPQNETIPHNDTTFTTSVTSGSTYTKLGSMNFTISNRTSTNFSNHIVIEWASQYTNNAGTDEVLNTFATIGGLNCSSYPRSVNSGTTGSVGGDCLLRNATTNQTYEISVYGNGTNAEYTQTLIAKEFLMSDNEIGGGTALSFPITFNGDTDTVLFNWTGGNNNHPLSNLFNKQSYSLVTNESTTATLYINMFDGINYTSVNTTRYFEAGKIGVLIGHDIFENVSQDNYTLELVGNCGSPTASCEIVGGTGIGYITDVTETLFEGFYIDAYDIWDNKRLFNLTANNGVSFSTITGRIAYFTTDELVNFTLTATDGLGYINKTFTNYNTSNDLNTSMAQTNTAVQLYTVYGNEQVINFTLVNGADSYSTTNGTLNIQPNYGNNTVNFTVPGYYNLTNVNLYVENETQSTILYEAYSSRLNVTVYDLIGSAFISNFTINLSSNSFTYTDSISTTNGSVVFDNLIPGSVELFVDAEDYQTSRINFTLVSGLNSEQINLYTTNSINFTFYDEKTKSLMSGKNVTVELISDQGSYNYTTSTGLLYADLIAPESYNVRYSSPGYDTRYYYFELTNRSHTDLELYLLNSTTSDTVTVTVIDENALNVEDALVKVLKFDVPTSTYILQQSLFTDVDGEVQFPVEFNSEFYYFIVEYPAGTQVAQTSPALIFKETLLIQISTGLTGGDDWVTKAGITSSIVYYRDTKEFVFKYNDGENTADQGCMYIYNNKYNSSSLVSSSCASGPVNTVTISVTAENGSYYIAKGYVDVGSDSILVAEKQVIIPIGSIFDYTSLFLVGIMILAFAMTAIKTGPASVVVLPVIGLAFARMVGLLSNYLTWGVIGSLLIVSIVLSFVLKRRFF